MKIKVTRRMVELLKKKRKDGRLEITDHQNQVAKALFGMRLFKTIGKRVNLSDWERMVLASNRPEKINNRKIPQDSFIVTDVDSAARWVMGEVSLHEVPVKVTITSIQNKRPVYFVEDKMGNVIYRT